jgi:hypothetical protein
MDPPPIQRSILFDAISVAVCLTIMCAYNIHYYVVLNKWKNARQVTLGANLAYAAAWLERHLKKEDPPSVTLAIQTIRNTIIVAVFVGGYAINFAFYYMNSIYLYSDLPYQMRSIILAIFLFLSFLAWASVIRLASHLGYIIGAKAMKPAVPDSTAATSAVVTTTTSNNSNINNSEAAPNSSSLEAGIGKITDTSSNSNSNSNSDISTDNQKMSRGEYITKKMILSFSLGFRFMFISIPFVFYSSGCIALLIATVVIMAFLISMDRMEPVDHID